MGAHALRQFHHRVENLLRLAWDLLTAVWEKVLACRLGCKEL
jgi:hypothetical protein